MTARAVVDEWGTLDTPIVLTGTNHVGIVYHWTVQYLFERNAALGLDSPIPMVAECDDSYLDGSQGRAIGRDEVYAALDGAAAAPWPRAASGRGRGCSSSGSRAGSGRRRAWSRTGNAWRRRRAGADQLRRPAGVARRRRAGRTRVGRRARPMAVGDGSCIVVLATDAPLNPASARDWPRARRWAWHGPARRRAIPAARSPSPSPRGT